MPSDKLQESRFEQKYIATEDLALQIREFVQSYLELDENGVGKPNYSYPVHSLYLDSDELKFYWSTINGDKNRFKLRLRFYNDNANTPIFFEIKRRMNNCILKQRGGVRRDAVGLILNGHFPDASHLVSSNPKQLVALENFTHLMHQNQAKPQVHIAYEREAYIPHNDNSARLTMDRMVRAEAEPIARLSTQMQKPVVVWGRELVRVFGLHQCGAAKYVDGAALLDESQLNRAPRARRREAAGGRFD